MESTSERNIVGDVHLILLIVFLDYQVTNDSWALRDFIADQVVLLACLLFFVIVKKNCIGREREVCKHTVI